VLLYTYLKYFIPNLSSGDIEVSKKIVVSPRKVSFTMNRYVISLPRSIGRKLHGKLVKVTIEVIEDSTLKN